MDWITILTIFGAVGTALSLADLAYKYGSGLFKKSKTENPPELLSGSRLRILRSLFKKSSAARPTPVYYRMLAGAGVFRALAGAFKKSKSRIRKQTVFLKSRGVRRLLALKLSTVVPLALFDQSALLKVSPKSFKNCTFDMNK